MFMKVLAINGSPRTNCNTATLLKNALDGAASQGAETELVHLYKLNFKGCISCFACKQLNGESYGRCAVHDDLRPVLSKAEDADALVLGSPIYFHAVTGEMRSFMERMFFPYVVYDQRRTRLFPRTIKTGFFYTMNACEDQMKQMGYEWTVHVAEQVMTRIFGNAESLLVYDTYQFDDYARYESTLWDEGAKARRRQEEFPKDCQKAFDMGVRFAQP